MARYTHGAPPPIPDFGSTPVDRQGGFLPATMPNAPDAGVVGYTPPAMAPVQIFPWWLYQYESAQAFYIKSLNFMVAASTITPVPTFTFTVPQQMRGVLQSIEMTVQSSTAAMNLQLTLLVQNAPLQGWSGVAFPPILATGLVRGINNMNVRLQQNQILTAQFAEASGSPFVCSLEASGWVVAQVDIDRLQQSVRY
jgi:hypothetical protein